LIVKLIANVFCRRTFRHTRAVGAGSYDWTEVVWDQKVPDNIVSARITIGLEKVSGSIWFDEITISHQ